MRDILSRARLKSFMSALCMVMFILGFSAKMTIAGTGAAAGGTGTGSAGSTGSGSISAGARLSKCDPSKTGGSGADGSDCNAGLYCNKTSKLCGKKGEVTCLENQCEVGKRCVDDKNQLVAGNTPGSCKVIDDDTGEDNALGDVMCNVFKLATGKAGRILIAIVLVGAGGTFLLGKMQLGSLLAIGAGAGFIFGAPAIVKVLVGRGFDC